MILLLQGRVILKGQRDRDRDRERERERERVVSSFLINLYVYYWKVFKVKYSAK